MPTINVRENDEVQIERQGSKTVITVTHGTNSSAEVAAPEAVPLKQVLQGMVDQVNADLVVFDSNGMLAQDVLITSPGGQTVRASSPEQVVEPGSSVFVDSRKSNG